MNHHVHHWSSSPPLIIIAIVDHFRHLWSPLPSLIIIVDHRRHHWSALPSLIAIVYLHRLWRHCWSPSPLLITITIVDHHHSSLSLIVICFLVPLSANLRFRLASTFALTLSVCLSYPPHETICSRIQNFFKFGMWIRYYTNSWTCIQNLFKFGMWIRYHTISLIPKFDWNRRTFTMFFGLFSYYCSSVVVFLLVPDL